MVAEESEANEGREQSPRKGSTLEGRVRVLLEHQGFHATTNRVVLDNEFDVWAEDREGRVVLAECKEYYDSGPATPSHLRNFFGKVHDIEQNYGADIYMALFVCVSGFTDAARSLGERLGVQPIDLGSLEVLEGSEEELTPRYQPLEDSAILELRKESDRLREELNRRQLVRRLSERIQEYTRTLQTRTIPSFLVPSSVSRTFWYSKSHEIPVVGVDGTFHDFVVLSFPQLDGMYFTQGRLLARFFGRKQVVIPAHSFKMEGGVVYRVGTQELTADSSLEGAPRLSELKGLPVYTLDRMKLGTAIDFLLSFQPQKPIAQSITVRASDNLEGQLSDPEFTLPGERLSLEESTEEEKFLVAHVRLSDQAMQSDRNG